LKISNLCNHNTSTLRTDRQTDGQTDRQTTCHSNTALCVASLGKNCKHINGEKKVVKVTRVTLNAVFKYVKKPVVTDE